MWEEAVKEVTVRQSALGRFAGKEQPIWTQAARLNWRKIYVQVSPCLPSFHFILCSLLTSESACDRTWLFERDLIAVATYGLDSSISRTGGIAKFQFGTVLSTRNTSCKNRALCSMLVTGGRRGRGSSVFSVLRIFSFQFHFVLL